MSAIPPPLSGPPLDDALKNLPDELPALVDEFLYEETVTVLAAAPEAGKTTLAIQINAALAGGHLLWDKIIVPKPQRVYYLQLEGSPLEFKRRLVAIRESIPFQAENFIYDPYLEGINFLDVTHQELILERIGKVERPALITIDPAYMAVKGGLSKDEPATAFTTFSNRLKQRFRCAILILHHTKRPSKDPHGKLVQDEDPFYGSQWLKAHADGFYYVERPSKAHQYVRLKLAKDRNRNLRSTFLLHYRPESYTNFLEEVSAGPALDRLVAFLTECRNRNVTTDAHEIHEKTDLAHITIKRLKMTQVIQDMIIFVKATGKKDLWKPK